ncbi:hypothetical protein TSAR_013870 [Trichomalopsis sarcophagae]|uniref:DNA/RNA non-specific endonuclease/pyrophosphatase/phosphodiesterase domain-containing protein n=1 Tax=Trichomalopsis sarcophagae TaxID=543379 RepID=A0A232F168_9HYME|nr:hypothetical protein TSAR_013870 [Trichomalopsis sarcophagae]
MNLQRIKFLEIILIIMYRFSKSESYCGIKYDPDSTPNNDVLRIQSENGPLIYVINSTHGPAFHYPSVTGDIYCVYYGSEGALLSIPRIYFACSGSSLKVTGRNGRKLFNTTYLTKSWKSPVYSLHKYGQFNFNHENLSCIDTPVSKMQLHKKTQFLHDYKYIDRNYYQVGFKVSEIDFLTCYHIVQISGFYLFGHATVPALIKKSPKLTGTYEYREGIIRNKNTTNFTEIYTKEFQMQHLRTLMNEKTVQKYFSDDNYLVKGHLVSKDDFFYKAQQISTFNYDNTFPIWRSIKEGNWQLIGEIVRKLADQSVSDMEIYTLPFDFLHVNSSTDFFAQNLNTSMYIPKILAKVVFSSTNRERGLVFHTANDPYINRAEMKKLMLEAEVGLCTRLLDCDYHPEFHVVKRGLTYCCALEDSKIRNFVMNRIRVKV